MANEFETIAGELLAKLDHYIGEGKLDASIIAETRKKTTEELKKSQPKPISIDERLKDIPRFWYLASPYAKYAEGKEVAHKHACEAAAELIARGIPVFSPIAHSHPIAKYGDLDHSSHDLWLPLDERYLEAAYGIIILQMPGWDESKGIGHEIRFCRNRGKPRVYMRWPSLEINRSYDFN